MPLDENTTDITYLFPLQIYEVIRVIKGVPLFLEDHIDRLYQSARLANINFLPGPIVINENLFGFIEKHNFENGNIKISFYFEGVTAKSLQTTEIIPHTYPSKEEYNRGISVSSMQAERILPNAKIQQTDIREKANKIILESGVWEVVLLDKHGFITEGSKTNIFFIKGESVITPPPEKILQGTTRKRIIKLCFENGIPVLEEQIHYTNLFQYESAFLTGTSPKVLPIKMIDNEYFTSNNEVMRRISSLYDNEIESYILSKKSY